MAERKVFQKYYPPDFDPSKVPRKRKDPNAKKKNMQTVRMMLPMSIQCTVCGEYLYRGKKFNSKKETVAGEGYLTLKVFRFYIKCTRCASTITFKTDPKNSTYVAEFNCTQNFDARKEVDKEREEREKQKVLQEGDKIKELEDVTLASKTEMEILDSLDEIRTVNAMHQKITPDQLLGHVQMKKAMEEAAPPSTGPADAAVVGDEEFTEEEMQKMNRLFGMRGSDNDESGQNGDDNNNDDARLRGKRISSSSSSSSSSSQAQQRKRRKMDAMAQFDIVNDAIDEEGEDDGSTMIPAAGTIRRLEDVEHAEVERMQKHTEETVANPADAHLDDGNEEQRAEQQEDVDIAGSEKQENALLSTRMQDNAPDAAVPEINKKPSKTEELTLDNPTSLLLSVKKSKEKKKKKSKKNAIGLAGLAGYGSDSD